MEKNFLKPEAMSSNVLFCPTNSTKSKNINFTNVEDESNHQKIHIWEAEINIFGGIFTLQKKTT